LNDAERAAMRHELTVLCIGDDAAVSHLESPDPVCYVAPIDPTPHNLLEEELRHARCTLRTIHYIEHGIPTAEVCDANFNSTGVCRRYRSRLESKEQEKEWDRRNGELDAMPESEDPTYVPPEDEPEIDDPLRLHPLSSRTPPVRFGSPDIGGLFGQN
jgi:hypothetical protein